MADEKQTFTFEQRQAGGEKLLAALVDAGIKAELLAEKGRTENFDSVRVRISDKAGKPTADLTVNSKGYINVGYVYTDGDQKFTARAQDIAEELQGAEVSAKFVKTKASPGGSSFLGKLN
jgi:hypothetical protein